MLISLILITINILNTELCFSLTYQYAFEVKCSPNLINPYFPFYSLINPSVSETFLSRMVFNLGSIHLFVSLHPSTLT